MYMPWCNLFILLKIFKRHSSYLQRRFTNKFLRPQLMFLIKSCKYNISTFCFIFHTILFQISQVLTLAERKFLYFNILTKDENGGNKTITVEGGGVNATLVQSDIAATNGFVHIIDRVLGIPYTNVQEKMLTDPMLKWVNVSLKLVVKAKYKLWFLHVSKTFCFITIKVSSESHPNNLKSSVHKISWKVNLMKIIYFACATIDITNAA